MKTPAKGIDQNYKDKFIDKYFGRMPMMLHMIEEAHICEVNPEYVELLRLFEEGVLCKDNLSVELFREFSFILNHECYECLLNRAERAIVRALRGEVPCPKLIPYLLCGPDDYMCCDDIFYCDEHYCYDNEIPDPDQETACPQQEQ